MKVNKTINRQESADFKRLIELCMANPAWQEAFFKKPQEWLDRNGLKLPVEMSLEAVRLMGCVDVEQRQANPYVREYDALVGNIHDIYRKATSFDKFSDSQFLAWYKRQVNRYKFQSSISRHQAGLFYIPVTFELSDGCSIKCPFCCLAAKELSAVFPYTEENREFWRGLLLSTQEMIGSIANVSICYFATEPFDNPDYEKFLSDFYSLFGRFPQTTTAASVKNVQRTKEFLKLLGEEQLKQGALRFSVVSLEQLQRIHKEFTSQELEFVELLMNNKESVCAYSKAGRSIELAREYKEKKFLDNVSCICTCGFIVNLPRREITLEAPHRPDSAHPLGMRVYEKRGFRDVTEYQTVLQEMIAKWMPVDMPEDKPLHPAAYITWQQDGYKLKARGDKASRTVSMSIKEQRCFEMLLKQKASLQELYKIGRMTEFERQKLKEKLVIFYNAGYLEELNN